MKRVHSLNVLALGILFIMPMLVSAQTNVLHRVFKFSSISSDYVEMGDDDDFDFENCWAIKDANLQIGSSRALGSVTTRSLGLNGNATVVLKVKGSFGAVDFKVSILNGDESSEMVFTTINNSESHPEPILIQNGRKDTKIKIETISERIDLISIDVYDIGSGIFYESFNFMKGSNNDDYSVIGGATAPSSECDYYIGSTISGGALQAKECLFFSDSGESSYTTPEITLIPNRKYYLYFNVAPGGTGAAQLSVDCGDNASMGAIFSYELDNTSSHQACTIREQKKVNKLCYLALEGSSVQLTFSGKFFFLSDVLLFSAPINIEEGADNSRLIELYAGQNNVMLTRTLGAGYWNTLCLPFDITQNELAEVAGEGANPEIQTLASASDGVFRFEPVDADATIEAGTPFIVKVSKEVVNSQFRNVVLKNVAAKAIEKGHYQFVGTYSPVNLNTDKTHYFLGKDGKLKYPGATANKMNGLRAYFVTPASGESSRVSINGEEMDAIELVDIDRQYDVPVYDLRGVRHNTEMLGKGVYIRDGRKIVIK